MTRKTAILSPAALAEFIRVFAQHTNHELEAMFGITHLQVQRLGHWHQLRKAPAVAARAAAHSVWPEASQEYLRKHYATGNTADIARHVGKTVSQVWSQADRMGLRKTKGARQEIGAQTAAQKKAHVMPGWNGANDAKDRGARLTAEERAKLPPVGMDTAKRTVAEPFVDTRFTVKEGEVVTGCGFAALGPGRYCEDGRQWGARP